MTPFVLVDDCRQALDTFDYIRERYKHFDPSENFEQILFCCRLLRVGNVKLKVGYRYQGEYI